jgi:hypothetical protein
MRSCARTSPSSSSGCAADVSAYALTVDGEPDGADDDLAALERAEAELNELEQELRRIEGAEDAPDG